MGIQAILDPLIGGALGLFGGGAAAAAAPLAISDIGAAFLAPEVAAGALAAGAAPLAISDIGASLAAGGAELGSTALAAGAPGALTAADIGTLGAIGAGPSLDFAGGALTAAQAAELGQFGQAFDQAAAAGLPAATPETATLSQIADAALSGGAGIGGAAPAVGAAAAPPPPVSISQAIADTSLPGPATGVTAPVTQPISVAGGQVGGGGLGTGALTSPLDISPVSSTVPGAGAAGSGTAVSGIAPAPAGISVGSDITSPLAGSTLPDITSQLPGGVQAALPSAEGAGAAGAPAGAGVGVPTGAIGESVAETSIPAGSELAGGGTAAADITPGTAAAAGGQGGGGVLDTITGGLKDVGGYLLKNPALLLGVGGIGANLLMGNQAMQAQKAAEAAVAGMQPVSRTQQQISGQQQDISQEQRNLAGQQAAVAQPELSTAQTFADRSAADRAAALGMQSYLTSGALPQGVQSNLDAATQAAIAATRSRYAQMGMSGSSSEAADIASLTRQSVGQAATIAQNLWTSGLQELQFAQGEATSGLGALQSAAGTLAGAAGTEGAAAGTLSAAANTQTASLAPQQQELQLYETLMKNAQAQDAALSSAISNFAGAAAGAGMRSLPSLAASNTNQTQAAA